MNNQSASASEPALTSLVTSACKAAADELRLKVLNVLANGSFAVLELCDIFDCKQSGLSHHLKVLLQGGLVETHREGNTIFYRLNTASDSAVATVVANLHSAAKTIALSDAERAGIAKVYRERDERSEQFFTKISSKFNEYQERIAHASTYLEACLQLIDDTTEIQRDRALEIGPGEGTLLPALAERFTRVVALDTANAMLKRAQTRHEGFSNIEFILGDIHHPVVAQQTFDCVVLNMVLHHVASPAALFNAIGERLTPTGVLVITDLAEHKQDWVQTLCGDLWLGFQEDTLTQWATHAGLVATRSMNLAQRNGFHVLAKRYNKSS